MLVGAAAPPPGSAGEEDGRLYCLCQSPHDNVVSCELAYIIHESQKKQVTRTTVAERNDRLRRGGLPRGVVPLRVRGHHGAAGGQVVLPRVFQALQHVLR